VGISLKLFHELQTDCEIRFVRAMEQLSSCQAMVHGRLLKAKHLIYFFAGRRNNLFDDGYPVFLMKPV